MAYAYAQKPQNRATAIAAVVGVHAGLGALLVYGLATGGITQPDKPPLVGTQIDLPPPPPPPDPVPEPEPQVPQSARDVVVLDPPIKIAPNPPIIDTTDRILPPSDPVPKPTNDPVQKATPPSPPSPPAPAFDPVPPRPANSQSGWVTQADYRSSWISRGYDGQVGYRLTIGASGRVEGCSVTRSSGVSALDQATCQLVTRRARFDPAKNNQGRAISGSYTGAVLWQIPN